MPSAGRNDRSMRLLDLIARASLESSTGSLIHVEVSLQILTKSTFE